MGPETSAGCSSAEIRLQMAEIQCFNGRCRFAFLFPAINSPNEPFSYFAHPFLAGLTCIFQPNEILPRPLLTYLIQLDTSFLPLIIPAFLAVHTLINAVYLSYRQMLSYISALFTISANNCCFRSIINPYCSVPHLRSFVILETSYRLDCLI